jgi:hypothetical protein
VQLDSCNEQVLWYNLIGTQLPTHWSWKVQLLHVVPWHSHALVAIPA